MVFLFTNQRLPDHEPYKIRQTGFWRYRWEGDRCEALVYFLQQQSPDVCQILYIESSLLATLLEDGAYACARHLVEKNHAWAYPSRRGLQGYESACPLYRAALHMPSPRTQKRMSDALVRLIFRADGEKGSYWDALKSMACKDECLAREGRVIAAWETPVQEAEANFDEMKHQIAVRTAVCALFSGYPWILEEVADVFALDLWDNKNTLFMVLVQQAILDKHDVIRKFFPFRKNVDDLETNLFNVVKHFVDKRQMHMYNTAMPRRRFQSPTWLETFPDQIWEWEDVFSTALARCPTLFVRFVRDMPSLPVNACNFGHRGVEEEDEEEEKKEVVDAKTLLVQRLEDQVFHALVDAGLPVTRDIVTLIVRAL